MARRKLGELLIEAGVIDEMQLASALGDQKKWGRPLGRTLVELGLLDEKKLVQALSSQLNIPQVDLAQTTATPEALQRLDYPFCTANNCFPFGFEEKGSFLDVAMADPTNPELFDLIRVQTRCNIRPHIAGHQSLDMAIRRDFLGEAPSEAIAVDNRPWMTPPDEVMHDAEPDPEAAATQPPGDRPSLAPTARDHLLMQLHETVRQLVANLERDEKVLRKVMALLVEKSVCTRSELVAKIYED